MPVLLSNVYSDVGSRSTPTVKKNLSLYHHMIFNWFSKALVTLAGVQKLTLTPHLLSLSLFMFERMSRSMFNHRGVCIAIATLQVHQDLCEILCRSFPSIRSAIIKRLFLHPIHLVLVEQETSSMLHAKVVVKPLWHML